MNRPLGMSSSLLWPRPLVEVVHHLAAAGFTLMEVASEHLLRDLERPGEAAAVSIHAAGQGIQVWSVHLPFGRDYELGNPDLDEAEVQARYAALLDRAADLGASVAVLHPTDLHRDQHPIPKTQELVRARFARMFEAWARPSLRPALEHMLPHLIGGRVQELLWLYDHLPHDRLGLCLDFGHAFLGGRLPLTVRSLRARLISTHIHDNHGNGDQHLLPGEGAIDWRQAIHMLDEIGYTGPLMLEPSPREMTVEELRELREGMEERLNLAGAR